MGDSAYVPVLGHTTGLLHLHLDEPIGIYSMRVMWHSVEAWMCEGALFMLADGTSRRELRVRSRYQGRAGEFRVIAGPASLHK